MPNALQREFHLDVIDRKLLHHLQQHGRLSFAELARRVRLSTPAVIERVRKLQDAGVILGYHAEVSAPKMGLPVLALIRMSVVGDVFARVAAVVRDSPEVLECHRGTGGDSFTMKVAVRSVQHLESLIDRLTPFGTTSTSVVLSSPVKRRDLVPWTDDGKHPGND
jgi:Lrp/AsnC family leucine-responsive transcriptional regulator